MVEINHNHHHHHRCKKASYIYLKAWFKQTRISQAKCGGRKGHLYVAVKNKGFIGTCTLYTELIVMYIRIDVKWATSDHQEWVREVQECLYAHREETKDRPHWLARPDGIQRPSELFWKQLTQPLGHSVSTSPQCEPVHLYKKWDRKRVRSMILLLVTSLRG